MLIALRDLREHVTRTSARGFPWPGSHASTTSISSSCLRISPGVPSPIIFCRNGLWSKNRSRSGRDRCGDVVEDLAELVGDVDLERGVRAARRLVRFERGAQRDRVGDVDARDPTAEEVAVLDRHARAVRGVRRGRVGGVADEGRAALGPLLQRRPVADRPALQARRIGRGDQLGERERETLRHLRRGRVQVSGELRGGVECAEHPPLEAGATFVADGGPAALNGSGVRDDATPGRDVEGVVEREAADDVEVVLALGGVAPQSASHERVDAVRADQEVGFQHAAIGQFQAHSGLVLVESS